MIKLLLACFYVLLTLLPNSHALSVAWPWVLIWQVFLAIPIVWLVIQVAHSRRLFLLGFGFDSAILLLLLCIGLNVVFAQHINQAIWQSITLLGFIAGVYALNQWLNEEKCADKLFLFQGCVSFAFIVISLLLWINQTFMPELVQLKTLALAGIKGGFNLNEISLRNWHPLGHQNYVAGYLSLALPVMLSLSLQRSGWQRYLWFSGFILGLVDLYTTYSRAGFLCLGLCSFVFCGSIIFQNIYSLRLRLTSLILLFLTLVVTLSNSRVIGFISTLLTNKGAHDGYRIITNSIGFHMGSTHFWTGVGIGNIPLLYQGYRPFWAGQEAEHTFQLHSTPAQFWAELGLLGVILCVVFLYLGLRAAFTTNALNEVSQNIQLSHNSVKSLWFGLLAYAVYSLTDYQLDNIAISGTLIIYGTLILSHRQHTHKLGNSPRLNSSHYRLRISHAAFCMEKKN
ncbi:MAG: O-antigen ligase family protein, partial [Leptolyngbya sp. SIO3F4]|nr:O-antigen ligase family protein [Leptolyngbya sp. SIO3F4]